MLVEKDESLSLETFMQVPYDENNISVSIKISVINVVSGGSISGSVWDVFTIDVTSGTISDL